MIRVDERDVARRGPPEGAADVDDRGQAEQLQEHARARAERALREDDADGAGARGDDEIEHGEVVAEEDGALRELGARVGRGEHQEGVAEIFDVAGALLEERIADGAAVGGAGHLARDLAERLGDAAALVEQLVGAIAEAAVAHDHGVHVEEAGLRREAVGAGAGAEAVDRLLRGLERAAEELLVVRRAGALLRGGRPAESRDGAERATAHDGETGERDLARAAAGAAVLLAEVVQELRVADACGDGSCQRDDEVDVVPIELVISGALDDDRAERAAVTEDRDRKEDGVAVLVELGERAVTLVLRGLDDGDGARALDGHSGDALAHPEADAAAHGGRKAYVSAEDELVAVPLEQVEGRHVGANDGGDAPRGLVEEQREGHRLRDEAHEIEELIELRLACRVDRRADGGARRGRLAVVRHAIVRGAVFGRAVCCRGVARGHYFHLCLGGSERLTRGCRRRHERRGLMRRRSCSRRARRPGRARRRGARRTTRALGSWRPRGSGPPRRRGGARGGRSPR